ncbi:MAG: DUF1667 domain-containing protein [Clostridia bacterium]|nr:DUF1667 domain-containing protein [Clostridia bacterium]
MENRTFTCIVCPEGCQITAETENCETGCRGNKCPRGIAYVKSELTDPRRNIASTVTVNGGTRPLVSVKTASPIPKDKIFEVMAEIRKTGVSAPVFAGQIIIENAAATGCDIVATSSVEKQ